VDKLQFITYSELDINTHSTLARTFSLQNNSTGSNRTDS